MRLSYKSRKRQSRNFNHDFSSTPESAITMGIGTMLTAGRIILMAWGEDKAEAVKAVVEGEISTACPASLLQRHDHIRFFTDETAASLLTRAVAPWLVGPCDWTPKLVRKAVVWLCLTVEKPILKLTEKDYLENSLGGLLEYYGSFDKVNIDVFNDLQRSSTISLSPSCETVPKQSKAEFPTSSGTVCLVTTKAGRFWTMTLPILRLRMTKEAAFVDVPLGILTVVMPFTSASAI